MILKNCRLIPELCEGFEEEMADIRIDGKKIAEILPAGGDYTGEEVIDCAGKTVIPGMYNLHDHLYWEKNSFPTLHDYTYADHIFRSINYANCMMSYGYTTIRDCGSIANVAITLRDAINAKVIQGPNIYACGPSFSPHFPDERLLDIYSSCEGYGHPIRDISDIKGEVRRQLSEGADFIKICGSTRKNEIKCDQDALGRFLWYPEEIMEFSQAAQKEGSYVAAHSTCVESDEAIIEAECYTLEHGYYLNQENVDRIVKHGFKTNYVPTVAATYVGWKQQWPTYETVHAGSMEALRLTHEAGVLIGWGTDDFQKDFKKLPAVEFIARADSGLSNIDILKQATINSAKILKLDKKKGTVKVGKVADLCVIDGNPAEDLTVFNNPCSFVFKNGKVVARDGIVINAEVK